MTFSLKIGNRAQVCTQAQINKRLVLLDRVYNRPKAHGIFNVISSSVRSTFYDLQFLVVFRTHKRAQQFMIALAVPLETAPTIDRNICTIYNNNILLMNRRHKTALRVVTRSPQRGSQAAPTNLHTYVPVNQTTAPHARSSNSIRVTPVTVKTTVPTPQNITPKKSGLNLFSGLFKSAAPQPQNNQHAYNTVQATPKASPVKNSTSSHAYANANVPPKVTIDRPGTPMPPRSQSKIPTQARPSMNQNSPVGYTSGSSQRSQVATNNRVATPVVVKTRKRT